MLGKWWQQGFFKMDQILNPWPWLGPDARDEGSFLTIILGTLEGTYLRDNPFGRQLPYKHNPCLKNDQMKTEEASFLIK